MLFVFFPLILAYKVMLYGAAAVGKTSLIHRRINHSLQGVRTNVGVDSYSFPNYTIWEVSIREIRELLQPISLAIMVLNVNEEVHHKVLIA